MKTYFYILLIMCFTFGWANTNLPIDVAFDNVVELTDPAKEKVVISPNPATSFTHIKLNAVDSKIVGVTVYSLLGNKLYEKAFGGNETSIQLNVQNYKKGKYLIKVTFQDGSTEVKALIKQ